MKKISTDEQKHNAAAAGVAFVEDKMMVGLGTGTTAGIALRLLGKRVRSGLKITGVPSSIATARLAKRCGIPLVSDLGSFKKLDLAFDGADEVDPQLNLIKGGGGALTREKIIASRSDRFIIMADEKKTRSSTRKVSRAGGSVALRLALNRGDSAQSGRSRRIARAQPQTFSYR